MKTSILILRLVGLCAGWLAATLPGASPAAAAPVQVAEQSIVLPTYLAGEPEPNPMFYFGRVSQGAEGRVYPYPLYDTLTSVKTNKTYQIVYLENEYVKIGVLPEIGGRLFEGVDKSNGYDFIYRQHVIKPALIGLIGAWISGGVEWNIPHHHRASTFLPVQHRVVENSDGSKTLWVGELEVRHRMRWAVGYTLHPGKSYLQCTVRIVNRTPLAQTMLCFANVAVHVNEQYQVIFPPGTEYVTHHHKREFTTWPIATTRYGGYDFSSGVDVSWFTNHISANSMFAWNYADDFFAGYDHGRRAGLMSVADHHLVPGKKLWTWGNGPRGRMWDKILTDDDGPYIELMVGAFSDNQPDYSWLQPFETKSVDMFWYPFREIGGVKKANLEAAVNLDRVQDGSVRLGFCTTAAHRAAKAALKTADRALWEETIAIDPTRPWVKNVPVPPGTEEYDLTASLSVDGREVVAYTPLRRKQGSAGQWLPPRADSDTPPRPVSQPSDPAGIKTLEELYLTGLRIEQFHDAAREPLPYWEEALRRDPYDARVNTALGIYRWKQARFSDAEEHLLKAIERLTANYTAPREGEPLYYLGLALKAQGKHEPAQRALFNASWSQAWRGPAYFSLAELATRQGQYATALDHLERSLEANALSIRALNLKAAVLRHSGRATEALAVLAQAAEKTDPLDVRLLAERWLAGDNAAAPNLKATLREHPAAALETAAEYGNAGLWSDGAALLELQVEAAQDKRSVSPLAYYYLGHFRERLGDAAKAASARQSALQASAEYCFPFQWEADHVLRRAMEVNPRDARAPYLLGNLLYDWQPEEAVRCWERSAELDPAFPIVHRNLAIACAHSASGRDLAKAVAHLERAIAASPRYARHFAELDELYAQTGKPPEDRLALLERHHQVVLTRDDALSREIGLKIVAGKFDDAIQLMTGRKFSVWEGGTLDVADQWVEAHLLRAHEHLARQQFTAALADLQSAQTIPENLPSDQRRAGGHDAEIACLTGLAHEGLANMEKAKEFWRKSAELGSPGPRERGRRRGGASEEREVQRFYQALSQRKLGQETAAIGAFQELAHADDDSPRPETEADAGPDARQNQRSARAWRHYAAGLGHVGLREKEPATVQIRKALDAQPDHARARALLRRLEKGE